MGSEMCIRDSITGAAGFIGFHAAKKFLNKGIKVHGFDSMNNYYDPHLKKNRLNILKKYKIFLLLRVCLKTKKYSISQY